MVMENHLVVLLLSLFVLICAFYGYTVEQKIFQIKNDLLQHEKEKKEVKEVKVDLESTTQGLKQLKVELESMHKELTEVKVDLETTRKEHKQVKVELETMTKEIAQVKVELELTSNAVKQVKVELDTTRNELKQVKVELDTTRNELKQVKVEMDATKEQINLLRKETLEKDNARKKEINQIRADVNVLPGELNKIKTENKEHNSISFSARLGKNIADINPFDTVVFDQVIHNYNNYYNSVTGIFTAPIAGTYYFSTTIFTKRGSLVELALRVNEKTELWIHANAQTTTNTATNSIIVKLNKDNTVRIIKNGAYGLRPYYIHNLWSTFTGFLL